MVPGQSSYIDMATMWVKSALGKWKTLNEANNEPQSYSHTTEKSSNAKTTP